MSKNNSKEKISKPDVRNVPFQEIDLTLEAGEWWRPWETGEDEVIVILQKVKSGQYGEFFIARDVESGETRYITIHAMLEPLKKFMNRVVKISYDGIDAARGRNGTHLYRAGAARGRAAERPGRPGRPNGGEDKAEELAE